MKVHGHLSSAHSLSGIFWYACVMFMSFGRSAVLTFFVLSGFVLTHSITNNPTSYPIYAIRRFFRIYPAYLVVILASFAIHTYIDGPQTSTILLSHLDMDGTKNAIHLDLAAWSLDHEMRISLFFPVLVWLVSRFRGKFVFASFAISLSCTLTLLRITGHVAEGFGESNFWPTWLDTGFFVFFFSLGSIVALELPSVADYFTHLSHSKTILAIGLFFICMVIGDHGSTSPYSSAIDYIRGFGAAGIIGLTAGCPKLAGALGYAGFRWLGRISYSLYLVHMPLIYVVTHTFGRNWAPIPAGLFAIGISLLSAMLVSSIVEFPCMRLGKAIARYLSPIRRSGRLGNESLVVRPPSL